MLMGAIGAFQTMFSNEKTGTFLDAGFLQVMAFKD
jgi:hypothetical protein